MELIEMIAIIVGLNLAGTIALAVWIQDTRDDSKSRFAVHEYLGHHKIQRKIKGIEEKLGLKWEDGQHYHSVEKKK